MSEDVNPMDIFATVESQIQDVIDPEEIVNIDIDEIDRDSVNEAAEMIQNLTKLYYDEDFLKNQPKFKKRVDSELESLRINLKMRKADERAHDILLKNIGANPSNASMYRAFTEIQKTIVNITTKIEETINRLNNMMKAYQMEINFDGESDDEEKPQKNTNSHRGTRAFIEAMENEVEETNE